MGPLPAGSAGFDLGVPGVGARDPFGDLIIKLAPPTPPETQESDPMGPFVGAGAAWESPRSSTLDFSPKVAVFALEVVEDAIAAQQANRKDADPFGGDFPIVSDDVTKEITSLTADNLSSRGHPWEW